jgi:hypothetical protein
MSREECRLMHLQHRHDILLKFYRLMHENTDDLGRIIVSIISLCYHLVFSVYIHPVDSREW